MTSPRRVTASNSSLGPCSATAMDPPESSPSSLSGFPDWERTRTSAAAASATEAAAATSTLATHTRSAVSHLYASTRPPPRSTPSSLARAHDVHIDASRAEQRDRVWILRHRLAVIRGRKLFLASSRRVVSVGRLWNRLSNEREWRALRRGDGFHRRHPDRPDDEAPANDCHVDRHVDRRLAIVCIRGRSSRLGRRTRPIGNVSLRRWIPRRRSPRARRRRRRRATPPGIPAAAAIPPAARPARAVPPSRSTDGYAKIQRMGHDTTPIPRRSPAPPRGRTVPSRDTSPGRNMSFTTGDAPWNESWLPSPLDAPCRSTYVLEPRVPSTTPPNSPLPNAARRSLDAVR